LRAQRVDLTAIEGGKNFADHGGRNTVLDLTLFTTLLYPSKLLPHRLLAASATLRPPKACAEVCPPLNARSLFTFERTVSVHF
jgi:hypothetical protein